MLTEKQEVKLRGEIMLILCNNEDLEVVLEKIMQKINELCGVIKD